MPTSVDSQRFKLITDDPVDGVLVGFECLECRVKMFGPATFCQCCASGNLGPVEFSTVGTLFSYTVIRVPPAGWPGPVPYILGEVELPEGPHVLAEIIDSPEMDLTIGEPMELAMRLVMAPEANEPRAVYKWRPTTPAAAEGRENL